MQSRQQKLLGVTSRLLDILNRHLRNLRELLVPQGLDVSNLSPSAHNFESARDGGLRHGFDGDAEAQPLDNRKSSSFALVLGVQFSELLTVGAVVFLIGWREMAFEECLLLLTSLEKKAGQFENPGGRAELEVKLVPVVGEASFVFETFFDRTDFLNDFFQPGYVLGIRLQMFVHLFKRSSVQLGIVFVGCHLLTALNNEDLSPRPTPFSSKVLDHRADGISLCLEL